MKTLESKLIEFIDAESKRHEDSDKIRSLQDAVTEFEILIKKGLIARRGYNLLSVEDALLNRTTFNTHQSH